MYIETVSLTTLRCNGSKRALIFFKRALIFFERALAHDVALWQVKKSVTDLDKTLNTNKSKVSKASDSVNAIR